MKKIKTGMIFRVFLCIIGAFFLANSVVLFFISNFQMGVLLEFLLGAVLFLCGIFFGKLSLKAPVWLKLVCAALAVSVCASGVFLVGNGINDTADYDEDVIIVLGAGVKGTRVGNNLKRRLDAAFAYYEKNNEVLIVVSGGKGPQESVTEAFAMEEYLLEKGVPQAKILKEEEASSTYENFLFSKKLLDERFENGFSACFVTNDFHVFRAGGIAQKAGFEKINHIHSSTNKFTVISNTLRECLAVVKFAVLGR